MSAHDRVGRTALVHYLGGITSEEPFDDHRDGEPEEIVLGVGEIPQGMDEALIDMEIGEERTVIIPCDRGFGQHDPTGVQTYARTFIENGTRLELGDVFAWTNPASGLPIPVKVIKADEQLVTIDFNHPLAGKELTYWLKLVDIK